MEWEQLSCSSVPEIRRYLKAKGWKYKNKKDICSRCLAMNCEMK